MRAGYKVHKGGKDTERRDNVMEAQSKRNNVVQGRMVMKNINKENYDEQR